jgi:hypothetical protein
MNRRVQIEFTERASELLRVLTEKEERERFEWEMSSGYLLGLSNRGAALNRRITQTASRLALAGVRTITASLFLFSYPYLGNGADPANTPAARLQVFCNCKGGSKILAIPHQQNVECGNSVPVLPPKPVFFLLQTQQRILDSDLECSLASKTAKLAVVEHLPRAGNSNEIVKLNLWHSHPPNVAAK